MHTNDFDACTPVAKNVQVSRMSYLKIMLPSETLYLTLLLVAKNFRNRGNKEDAVQAFAQPEGKGLSKTVVIEGTKRTQVRSHLQLAIL